MGKRMILMLVAATLFGGSLFDRVRDLPPGAVGEQYGTALKTSLSGDCSTPGVAWQLAAGALPKGLRLNGGRLEGLPEATGRWDFALRVSSACADAVVPVRVAVTEPRESGRQEALISVQSRSRSR